MALLFNNIERVNPTAPNAPKLWYPLLKSTKMVREKEVAKKLADETTLNPKEAEIAIHNASAEAHITLPPKRT
ncbi:MAG: hypothetical protein LBE13_17320 [Bacteroidales bacterium]|jgi:hypothetical protein|nr:hypothetical protein [Bacteroidales bacterium]